MNRRGFTLTELLMAMMVMGILGSALTRILVNDSRFVSRQDAMLASRQTARAALNTILSELSMVSDGSVIAASRDSIAVRVPYAFGIACKSPGAGLRVVSLMPVDSLVFASMDSPGIFWRSLTGTYTRIAGVTITTQMSDSTYCRQDSVRVIPGGKVVRISGLSSQPEDHSIIQVYERVTYKFAASTDLSGRVGLWRQMSGAAAEELVTPFDTSARFAYLIGGAKTATLALRTSTPVASTALDSIRGVELRLYAASENKAQGQSSYNIFPLKTRVRFNNQVVQ